MGTSEIPFSKTLFIEQDDFMENPPKDFYRLAPDREVRLRYAYFIKCNNVVKKDGKSVELHCTYDPATKGGYAPDGQKSQINDPLGFRAACDFCRSTIVRQTFYGH